MCWDKLPSLNLIVIRFTSLASIKNTDSASESWTLHPLMEKAKSFESETIEKIFHSQNFICYQYGETRKTYPK